MIKRVILIILGLIIVLVAAQQIRTTTDQVNEQPEEEQKNTVTVQPTAIMKKEPPSIMIDASKSHSAVLHTDKGDITIELFAKQTPLTVSNFIALNTKDFYDNTVFHRTIKGFMIQGGDPTGTGSGGPGYKFDDEPFEGKYEKGTVAMANSGPDTNGSQFFIMHEAQDLPPNYTIFGKVVKGIDVVDKIASAKVTMSESGEMSKPVTPVKILSIDLISK